MPAYANIWLCILVQHEKTTRDKGQTGKATVTPDE